MTKINEMQEVTEARKALEERRAQKAKVASESWVPDDNAKEAAQERNLKNVPVDGTAPVYVGGIVMLVGDGHDVKVEAYVDRQAERERGKIVTTKSPFKLIKVSGISKNQELVGQWLKQIVPDRKVKFE